MSTTLYDAIIKTFLKNKQVSIISPPIQHIKINEVSKIPDFGPTGLIYTTHELISIDDKFDYYHHELSGNPEVDMGLIYGSLDTHNSAHVLTRSAYENITKIKRNHDITLTKCDNKYIVANGRHRLVYLKRYYEISSKYCQTKEELDALKELVTIPVRINKRIEDKEINEILISLKNIHQDIKIYKTNLLNDDPELAIMHNNKLYYLKNKQELIDFYNNQDNEEYLMIYELIEVKEPLHHNINEIFELLYNLLGQEIYSFNYISLIRYLKINPIVINGTKINVENIDLRKLYVKYLDMITCYMICNTYDVELPTTTNFDYSSYSKEHQIGIYLMQIINEHLEYSELKWPEIYEILITYPKLSKYDSDYLKDIAMEHGIRELIGDNIFNQRKKK